MHCTLALASLAAIVAAAPLKTTTENIEHGRYTPGSVAVEETVENAQTDANNIKRGSMNMADDIRYTKYPSYEPYAKYVPYSSAVEEAAAKMNMAKRHEMKVGTTGSIMVEAATMVKDDFKGDNENPTLGTGYGTYDPYSAYAGYKRNAGAKDKMDV